MLDRRRRAEETTSKQICSTSDSSEHVLFCLGTAEEQDKNTELSSSHSVLSSSESGDGSEDEAMISDDVDDHDDEQAPAFFCGSRRHIMNDH